MAIDFGRIVPVEGGAEPVEPTLRYRAVFSVTGAKSKAEEPHHDLVRAARFLAMLREAKATLDPGDVIAIVSGRATSIVTRREEVDTAIIEYLIAGGATVAVCGQALHHQGIERDDVVPRVRIDVAAVTTLANLQLKGWVLIPG